MSASTAVFVLSNDTHARMFAPVARELERHHCTSYGLSLDPWYGQGAERAATATGMPLALAPSTEQAADFYRRSATRILADAVRARPTLARVIQELGPRVVIVGNDRGLLEKIILRAARRSGATTVLVQDGALAARPVRESTWSRRAWRATRRGVSAAVSGAGFPDLTASEYGKWGCDLICAAGPAGMHAFVERGVDRERIVIVGQPRYDELRPVPAEGRGVVWFTTPFLAQNLGRELQDLQGALVRSVADSCTKASIPFTVKPHPREDPSAYLGLDVAMDNAEQVLRSHELAIIGISTVIEEAGILGIPVMVPGAVVHGSKLEALLPDRADYPRFEAATDVVNLLRDLRSDPHRRTEIIDGQRQRVASRITFDETDSAASKLAMAIMRAARSHP